MTRLRASRRARDIAWLLLGLGAVLGVALWVAQHTETNFFTHSAFDSYAKQAMAWRDGRIALDQDYPWLELAIYEGNYYVSFPPVPAIPMWLLSFVFGENTPSGLMTLLYFLGAFVLLQRLMRRYLRDGQATLVAVFVALGGSVLDLAVSGHGFAGGVWYQAQLLGMLFTAMAFLLVDGQSRAGWAFGLIGIALAVGCRPFNAVYVPVLLWMLYRRIDAQRIGQKLLRMLPYMIVPGLIAVAYGVYNYARFGNPLEFGHAYLPELEQAGEPMFVPARLGENIRNILRVPVINGANYIFPVVSGFGVYLTNPMLWMGAERGIERAVRRKADVTDALLGAALLLHAALLLMHRTNGGWQYGTRYLCDLLPALAYLFVRGRKTLRRWELLVIGALIVVNVYGTIVFHWI